MTEALRHARYVLSENPVMSFAFGLFSFFVLCAIFGSVIAPYDPLASDTAQALRPPSLAHLFGTDQLGRDIFSRVLSPRGWISALPSPQSRWLSGSAR